MPPDQTIFLLFEVGLLIVVASLVSELFKKLRLPGIIGAIIVGILIGGPGGLGLISDYSIINLLAVLGSILILFSTGLEFDASAFWKVGRKAFLFTTFGVILSVVLGYWIGLEVGLSWKASVLLGAVIAPSGTTIIATILTAEGAVETKPGSTLLTAAVVDDIEGVLLLTVVLGVITQGTFSITSLIQVGLVASLFIFVSIYIGGKSLPSLIKKFGKYLSDEVLFAVLLGLGIMLAFVSTLVGLAAVTGAFIMGAIIPSQKVGEKLANKIQLMKEIFAAVFFASIGLAMSPVGIYAALPIGLVILGVALLARLAGGLIGGRLAGFRGKTLWTLTIGLAVRAEMSFIIAYEGVAMGIVGNDFFTITAITVIGSMFVVIPVFSRLVKSIGPIVDL